MRRVLAAIVAAITAVALAACGSESDAAAPSSYRVGFMIWNTTVPFYSRLISTAEQTAGELGVDLDIRSGNGDLATQVSVVQQFVAEGVDMILISPSDPAGIVPAVRQANSAGIPVMAVNTLADTSTGADIVTYVGVDDVDFGRKQGELLVQAIGEQGRVGYVLGALGTSAQLQRQQGLMEVLAQHPGIEIVAEQTANWDNAQALGAIQDMLNRFGPGQLNAIVGQGPESVNGAREAVASGRTDVKFVLGDYPADVRAAIRDGAVFGTVVQDPAPQGEQAIRHAVAWLKGDTASVPQPQAFIDMPVVTAENVEGISASWGE
jgi:ABC-type sugar transport system substrate-binding protein